MGFLIIQYHQVLMMKLIQKLKIYKKMLNMQKIQSIQNMQSLMRIKQPKQEPILKEIQCRKKLSRVMML